MKKFICVLICICLVFSVQTQGSRLSETQKQIVIQTDNTDLVFSVGKNQKLYQVYLGVKLDGVKEYSYLPNKHTAYIPSGTDNLFEPAIKMLHNDGNPSLELLFADEKNVRDGNQITTLIITD